MALISINGTTIKTPKKFSVAISDVDGASTRNANGTLMRDRIGTKRKLELEFAPLTQTEISTILNAISSVFFNVTYLDAKDGVVTKTMYVGDRTSAIAIYGNGTNVLWEGLKFSLIEQ